MKDHERALQAEHKMVAPSCAAVTVKRLYPSFQTCFCDAGPWSGYKGLLTMLQVAAHAERHILAEKTMRGERPCSSFRVLHTREEKVAEVAEMLGLPKEVAEAMLHDAMLREAS
jgi:hypothetical protein